MTAEESRSCPVCGERRSSLFAIAHDVEYCTGDQDYEYRECPACEAVFLVDPPTDRLREIYPRTYYSYATDQGGGLAERIKARLDARMFRSILRSARGDSLAALDVGGGSGWLLTLARRIEPRLRATHEVDLDEAARAAAEAAGHVFHCSRIEDFRSERAFDLVMALNLIEHVSDPRAVLTSIAAMLAEGGRVLLKTPNTDTWDRRLFQHRNWGGYHCPRHFVLFTRPGLIALAAECGLEVERASYTQGGPQWAPSLLGLLSHRGLVRVTPERPMYQHPLYQPLLVAGAAFDFLRRPFAPTAQMFLVLRRAS